MKINLLSIILIIVLLIVGYLHIGVRNKLSNAKEVISTLENNSITYKTNKDSSITATTKTLLIYESNIKALLSENSNLKQQIKKLSNLQSLIGIKYQIKDSFIVEIKDSTRIKDSSVIEKFKYFDYQDNYLTLHGEEVDKNISFSYYYQDSVNIILYKKPLGKWYQFWKWGKKQYLTNVTFKNPKAEAIKIESILVK